MRRRALVVDDEPAQRRIMRRYLEAEGYEVLEAPDGGEGLARFRAERVDLVVSDVIMEPEDGLALLRGVRGLDPSVPFILVSGAPDLAMAQAAVREGADDFVFKPVERASFLHSLGRVLERRQLREELAVARRREAERTSQAEALDARRRSLLDLVLHEVADAAATVRTSAQALEGCAGDEGARLLTDLDAGLGNVLDVLRVVAAVERMEAGEAEPAAPLSLVRALEEAGAPPGSIRGRPGGPSIGACAEAVVPTLRVLLGRSRVRSGGEPLCLELVGDPPGFSIAPFPALAGEEGRDGALLLARYAFEALGARVTLEGGRLHVRWSGLRGRA
ncbi:MAG: response regulator [Planctomycetes bacterium]|nr:response regulator [Planctomycetota bacterium]